MEMVSSAPRPEFSSRFGRLRAGGLAHDVALLCERLRANCNALVRLHARSGSGESVVIYWRRQRLAVLHGDDDCHCVFVRRRQA